MRKMIQRSILPVFIVVVLGLSGCRDGVRQKMTPYIIVGFGDIVSVLLAGLEHHIYPEVNSSEN